MKKNLLIASLLILITPSMVFASWWNPFSWAIFHREDTKTQVLERQIKELENKLNTATTTASTSKSVSETVYEKKADINVKKSGLEKTNRETFDTICKSDEGGGVNSEWNGTETKNLARRFLCNCKAGYVWGNPNGGIVTCVPVVTKTNDQLCQSDFGENSIWNGKLNSDGGLSCGCRPNFQFNSEKTKCVVVTAKTPVQICQERFGIHATVSNTKDTNGNKLCACEDGYVTDSSKTTCQKQQQGYDGSDPYGVFKDGVVYSPEQREQIECAYYGTSCFAPKPVINNYYQYKPSVTPVPTINCANYQIEKNMLDQTASNQGSLFSGARVSSENALKAKYPGCY